MLHIDGSASISHSPRQFDRVKKRHHREAAIAQEEKRPHYSQKDAVKAKWKNIRDTYTRIINKNPEYLVNYKGKWPFFKELHFLASQYKHLLNKVSKDVSDNYEYITLSQFSKGNQAPIKDQSSDYDLLFLESLVPYFIELEPVRRAAMKCKIQEMIMEELIAQNDEDSQDTLNEDSSNESE